MSGRRRYKVGDHPIYDKAFDLWARESVILNPETQSDVMNFGIVAQMTTRNGLRLLLEEWDGEEGEETFRRNRVDFPSVLKQAENKIAEIGEKFDRLKQRKVNEGNYPPEEMPPKMLDELHQAEAVEDVVRAEIVKLKDALSNFHDEKTEKEACLKRGPEGSGRLQGGILVIIDGQEVKQDDEGVLRICDSRSPYNGMMVADYKLHVVKPWKQAKTKLDAEYREEMKSAQQENREPKVTKHWPPFPQWPEGVEKHKWE